MKKVPVKGIDTVFRIDAKIIMINDYKAPVFEVKVSKNITNAMQGLEFGVRT